MGNCRFCSRECYAQSQAGFLKRSARLRGARVAAAAAAKKAMTHCKRGHALSGGNLFIASQAVAGARSVERFTNAHTWRKSVVKWVEIGNARLALGDCRDILPTLPKVDACITDPPYGILNLAGEG